MKHHIHYKLPAGHKEGHRQMMTVINHDSYYDFVLNHNNITLKDGNPDIKTNIFNIFLLVTLKKKSSELSLIYHLHVY